ncbi:MAG TPA: Clp protease N-terminal domain-containing protein [Longimicrobiales bacterium]
MSDLPGFGPAPNASSRPYAAPLLTNRATAVLAEALQTSRRRNREEVGTEDLLLALLSEGGVVATTLQALGVDAGALAERVRASAPASAARSQTTVPSLAQVRKALDLAEGEARQMRQALGPEHLLLGLLAEQEGLGPELLREAGLSLEATRRQLEQAAG